MAERVSIVAEITFHLLASLYGAIDKSHDIYCQLPNVKKKKPDIDEIQDNVPNLTFQKGSFYFIFLEREVNNLNQYDLVHFPASSLDALPAGTVSGRKAVNTCFSKIIYRGNSSLRPGEICPRVVLHLGVGKHRSLA